MQQQRRWEDDNPAKVPELRRMWDVGVATRAMAKQLGMSLSTLFQVKRRLRLNPRPAVVRGKENAAP